MQVIHEKLRVQLRTIKAKDTPNCRKVHNLPVDVASKRTTGNLNNVSLKPYFLDVYRRKLVDYPRGQASCRIRNS